MGLLDDIRGLLTPKPAVVPNPFDRQANAAIPIMGASEILPNMVGRMTGSPMAEFAAGFLSPSSWIKQPKKLDIFVGKKGIKNLGLDDVLEKARQMEKAGKSRDEIWEATAQMAAKKGVPGGGIGRGVDKQWRFEISDKYDIIDSPQGAKEIGAHWKSGKDKHLSSLYEGGSPSITQHMAMSHDDLFKAYPELRATNLTGGADKSRGSFSGDTVTMRWDDIARASNPQKVDDLSEPMSTNLHELQHAIQQREGLARGGSPDLFDAGPMFSGKANELASDLSQNLTGGLSAKPQEIVAAVKYGDPKELAAIAQKHGFGSIDDALKFLSAEDVKRTPFGQYQRLAGEAEARLTQSRMNMTPLDRQMFPPWSQKELGGYDVPEAQQIVRFGDGPAMSTGRPRNHLGQEIPPTPYELAHAEAQRVAALPVEQGGLGLPPNNTAIDRAKAMGFDTDRSLYHGTKSDIREFVPSSGGEFGSGVYSASDPNMANMFASFAGGDAGENIIPLLSRANSPLVTSDRNIPRGLGRKGLAKKGFDSVEGIGATGQTQNVVLDPSMLRSRFAAFNPAKRDSADLLAGLAPWALPVGATLLGGSFLLPPEEY